MSGDRSRSAKPRVLRRTLTALAVALLSLCAGLAQERFSALGGVVYDASGAVVPDAEVTVVNQGTRRAVVAWTAGDGRYAAPALEPGRYSAVARKQGFSAAGYSDVVLLLGRAVELDFTLMVGAVSDAVEVSAATVAMDLVSATVAHNVTAEEFDRLPKGRSFQSVALTAPSVNAGALEGGFQVNGASAAENQFTVDGISTTSVINGVSRGNAAFEYLQEVQVKTSGLDAEFGGALGGVISAVTKTGGDAFHGEVHWYNSGSPYDAKPSPRLGTADPSGAYANDYGYVQDDGVADHTDEAGFSVGGPVVKGKLFFFTAYSPRFTRRASTVEFADGPGVFENDQVAHDLFGKLTWDAADRVRANLGWLHQSTGSTGLLPDYRGLAPNAVVDRPASYYDHYRAQGWRASKDNYSGSVDVVPSAASLVSLRGGYFRDEYRDTGVPAAASVYYYGDPESTPDVPEGLLHPAGWFNVPNQVDATDYDTASRAYFQADFTRMFDFLGRHTLKVGAGVQKNVNKVSLGDNGGYWLGVYWGYDSFFEEGDIAPYGFYLLEQYETKGSAGSTIDNMYVQDQWRVHPRLTLSLGLRAEKETVPSFRRDIKDYFLKFGWGDKLAPRLGASLDVLGDGKWKLFGSWGLFYDWTKYDLSRGFSGGDVWREWYVKLEDPGDVPSIDLGNRPGALLDYVDYRIPDFGDDAIDPGIKPMRQQTWAVGSEYRLDPQTTLDVRYTRSLLRRTVEDIGYFVPGEGEGFRLGNPGEGASTQVTSHFPHYSYDEDGYYVELPAATPDFAMPKPKRQYDAVTVALTRRFSQGWFLGANYTWSRLQGNYAGLSNTDEVSAGGWAMAQGDSGVGARPGSSATRNYDSELYYLDAEGRRVEGRLATDRPHVFKAYGSYEFKWGTSVSASFYAGSGTPLTTTVAAYAPSSGSLEMMVNGRGDAGRTPVLTQTDLLLAHEVGLGGGKKLRIEFNVTNLFNQKTVRHIDTLVNRTGSQDRAGAGIDLNGVNLLEGFDWRQKLAETYYAQDAELSSDPSSLDPLENYAVNPTYGRADMWNPGFSARFGVKFVF
ncbi:MAG: TonB-dependent receptor [Acidobacteriota bacterium]|nr:TonB-dependent receptor [Acidobacteriota bacterium]